MIKKHIHKYKLKDLNRDLKKGPYYVYICILPDCSHYLREELIDDKQALCHRCEESFIIRKGYIRQGNHRVVKPICQDCVNRKGTNRELFNNIDMLVKDLTK